MNYLNGKLTLSIMTPDIFVETTDIPNPYNLADFVTMHAMGPNGEVLDNMITYDDSQVDYSTPGDYMVYALVIDKQGDMASDYFIVHVLTAREAKKYERNLDFPGLDRRLKKSQPQVNQASNSKDDVDFEDFDTGDYRNEELDGIKHGSQIDEIKKDGNTEKKPKRSVFSNVMFDLGCVGIVALIALLIWGFYDLF